MEIYVIKPTKEDGRKLRVCAYARVSTSEDEQENSLENQMEHYREFIQSNPMYEFVKVYYDFGISGFKEKRPGFQEMMQDAREGKIDLIIAKSISRFARNTVTVLSAARELKELGVGIFFELQNINTLTEAGELMLTVLSAFAQAESENYSIITKMGIQRKYEKGEPIRRLERSFGYSKNEDGEYNKKPEEAVWIKRMYVMIADGYSPADVKRFLNENGVKTVQGKAFTESTVIRIIENVIYKGDFIMHKYFVNADRKIVRNRGEVDSWYISDDHPAIVSKKLWQKAQDALAKRRAYLAEGSIVGENTEEVYPYKNKIYCAICGYPLYRRVHSYGNRVNWGCSGQKRFNTKFCSGINVPDSVIRSFGVFDENIYIREEVDALGKSEFKYQKESTWKRTHTKKEARTMPALNEENYPYYKKIFCKKCGSRLTRVVNTSGDVRWACIGANKKGIAFCTGVRVPDEVIRTWEFDTEILIEGKEGKDGKKSYSYSCKTGR